MTELLAFLGVALVVIVTPGQDTALTLKNTMVGGQSAGLLTAVGVVCGQATWAVATAAGAAALLAASDLAFAVLTYVGAAYLVFVGVQGIVGAATGRYELPVAKSSGSRPWRQGLLSNLGNPKMAVFFSGLLPQFADSFVGLLAFGLLFCSLTMGWLAAYAALAARLADTLRRPTVRRVIEGVSGAALAGLGVRFALLER